MGKRDNPALLSRPPHQDIVLHDRYFWKHPKRYKDLFLHKYGLIAIWELQIARAQVGAGGDKTHASGRPGDSQAEGASNTMGVLHGLLYGYGKVWWQAGVGMKKQQDFSMRVAGSLVLLAASPWSTGNHLETMLNSELNRPVAAAAIHEDYLMTGTKILGKRNDVLLFIQCRDDD